MGGVPDREHPFEDGDVDDAARPRLHQAPARISCSGVAKERGVRRREAGEEDPREETLGDGGGAQDAGSAEERQPAAEGRERSPHQGHIKTVKVAAGVKVQRHQRSRW